MKIFEKLFHDKGSLVLTCDIDDLGFIRPWSQYEKSETRVNYEEWYSSYLPIVVRRRSRWEKENPRSNAHLLQRFVRKGIPHIYRKDLWLRNCPARPSMKYQVPDDVIKAIRLDLPRTFPDNRFLKSEKTQKVLGRALFALAENIPSIGYCQGLNFVAGIILLVTNDEQKSIDLFVHLISQREEYYGESMIGLRRDLYVLHLLLREYCPRVVVTLERLDIGLELLIGKWFLCLFVESLPLETVLRIWDCLIYEGDEWLFKVSIILFRSVANQIYEARSIDQILTIIQSIGTSKCALYCHQLILKSSYLPITGKRIEELRIEAERKVQ